MTTPSIAKHMDAILVPEVYRIMLNPAIHIYVICTRINGNLVSLHKDIWDQSHVVFQFLVTRHQIYTLDKRSGN